jgi:hypothetical protein
LRDIPILPVSSEILKLAEDLIAEGPIPPKVADDAAHIAIATVYGAEYLLTWNCRHIANTEMHRAIRRVVEEYGYEMPSLCTQEELMGGRVMKWKDEIVEVRSDFACQSRFPIVTEHLKAANALS